MQNYFDRNQHKVEIKPHGNSIKEKKPFTRTQPSTIQRIKTSMKGKCPKKAVREVESSKGGLMEATSSCELPRNRRQAYNLKHYEQLKKEKDHQLFL